MKKLTKILPVCGFVIAVALVGVTSAFKEAPKTKGGQTLYQFQYDPPTGSQAYSVANVENVANWKYAPSGSCNSDNIKACTIMASHVDDSDPTDPVLLNSENITAQETSTDVSIVASTADAPNTTSSNIQNRVN